MVGAIGQVSDELRECPAYETIGPLVRTDAAAEIDEVHLDLAPTPERQQGHGVLAAGDRPDRSTPDTVGQRRDVADGPARESRGSRQVGVTETTHHGAESVMSDPAPVDLGLRPVHLVILRAPP